MSSSHPYQDLIAKIERLQTVAAVFREREKKPVLKAVTRAIVQYGITLSELKAALASAPAAERASSRRRKGQGSEGDAHPLSGRKIAAKYRCPKTGQTWSGRGSTPVWLRELESQGVQRETLLVKRRKS
jgi:DNA-binding protein H-NS